MQYSKPESRPRVSLYWVFFNLAVIGAFLLLIIVPVGLHLGTSDIIFLPYYWEPLYLARFI